MNMDNSSNYKLSDFNGRFCAIPNVLLDFLPSKEYMIFALIYSSSKKCLCSDKIVCSQNVLEKRAGIGKRKVKDCIDNLQRLNLIKTSTEVNKTTSFIINWNEVYALDSFASKTSYIGLCEAKELCFQNNTTVPFSSLSKEQLEDIANLYPIPTSGGVVSTNKWCQTDKNAQTTPPSGVKCANDVQITPPTTEKTVDLTLPVQITPLSDNKLTQLTEMVTLAKESNWSIYTLLCKWAEVFGVNSLGGVVLTKLAQITPLLCQNNTTEWCQTNKNAEITPLGGVKSTNGWCQIDKSVQITPLICNQVSHYFIKSGNEFTLNVVLSNAEQYLLESMQQDKLRIAFLGGVISTNFASGGVILTSRWCQMNQNAPKTCSNDTTDKIYINIKENDGTERSEVPYIGGKEEKSSENVNEAEKNGEVEEGLEKQEKEGKVEEADKVEEDGNTVLPVLIEPYKDNQEYCRRLYKQIKEETVKNINPYRNKPYFSEEDIQRITSIPGVEEAVYSPVKLFIFNFWGGLYDWYKAEKEEDCPTDEYGEPLPDSEEQLSDLDLPGKYIPSKDLAQTIITAWEETKGQIEMGKIEVDGVTFPVQIKEVPEIKLGNLIEWKSMRDDNNKSYVKISWDGFRNIEAEDAIEIKQAKTFNERANENINNRHFIAAIKKMDDSQLTPMELVIKEFVNKFVVMDEFSHTTGFLNDKGLPMINEREGVELPGWLIKPWSIRLFDFNIKPNDFYELINLRGGYKDGMPIPIGLRSIFNYQKVQRWNGLHGYKSNITQETLDNAIPGDYNTIDE